MASELNFNEDRTINNFSPFFRDIILNRNINNLEYFRERNFDNFFNYSEIGSINSIDRVGNNNSDITKTSLKEEANKERPKFLKNNIDNSIYFNNLGFNQFNLLKPKIGSEYNLLYPGNNNTDIVTIPLKDFAETKYNVDIKNQNRFIPTKDNDTYDVNKPDKSYYNEKLQREYRNKDNTPITLTNPDLTSEESLEKLSVKNRFQVNSDEYKSFDIEKQNYDYDKNLLEGKYYDKINTPTNINVTSEESLEKLSIKNRFQSTSDNIANRYNINNKSYDYDKNLLEREYYQNGNSPSINYSNDEIRELLSRRNVYENFESRSYDVNSQINLSPNEQFNYKEYYDQATEQLNPLNPISRFPLIQSLITNNPNDKLGKIGREELQRHATQRALTALSNKTNSLSEISLSRIVGMSNGNYVLNNEPITVPGDSLSLTRIIDYGARMLGAVNPLRVLPTSIEVDGLSSTERSNRLLKRTSFQSRSFISNSLNENKYIPNYNYQSDKIGKLTNKLNNKGSDLYGFTNLDLKTKTNKFIDNITSIQEKGFKTLDSKLNNNIAWDSDIPFSVIDRDFGINENGINNILDFKSPTKSFLLAKTRKLFKDGHIDTLIDRTSLKSNINNEIETPATNGQISKGSGVLNDGSFCRVFSKIGKKYNSVPSLQKNKGLDSLNYNDKYSINQNKSSVLGENGFVRIAPNADADKLDGLKKYMFSIENLAWAGYANPSNLPELEIGNGDENGVKGRIMWFPPYISSINDNSTANWNANDFIGRGESVYTYINGNRSMNLNFRIVVDHPDYLNDDRYKNVEEDKYSAFLAGCIDKLDDLTKTTTNNGQTDGKGITVKSSSPIKPNEHVSIYFPNNSSDVNQLVTDKYELNELGIGKYQDDKGNELNDTKGNFLNSDFFSKLTSPDFLLRYSDNNKTTINVNLIATTTTLGGEGINNELVINRANNVIKYLEEIASEKNIILNINEKIKFNTKLPSTTDYSNKKDKEGRYVKVTFSVEPKSNTDIPINVPSKDIEDNNVKVANKKVEQQFYDESKYFKEIEGSFVEKQIKDRIKNFHPTFHAITPQGFNHRLTFLHQCTRQGPTIDNNKNKADNLVFGKPPVCILRVGDFYHTKCIIETVNIDYEPLVWDLNPEGIGVQPMIANISLSIKLIGGSGLRGAISRLQNAVTFNFFGNTQVFDSRSDYVVEKQKIKRGQTLKRNEK